MDSETAGKMRGMIRRVIIRNLNDKGGTQTADVQIAAGVWHKGVEVLQPFGLAGSVPEDGAVGLALCVGGDAGDMVLLPLANPHSRFGNTAPGESCLYTSGGDYILLKADGTLEVAIGASATLELPAGMVIKTPSVKIEGGALEVDKDIICHGSIKADGDVSDKKGSMDKMRATYNSHSHPANGAPPGDKMG